MVKLTKWLKTVVLFALSAIVGNRASYGQEVKRLTLEEALELARKNYPLIRQQDLINQNADISVANLMKGFLPQFSLSGQASYQSEVTEIDIPVPGVKIDPLSKDQYKVVADLSQTLYDGGITREQKNLQRLSAHVEQQKLEVEMYKLKDRISQLYLSILYLDEQLRQVDLIKTDLNNGIRRVEAQVNNGTAFRSNLSLLQAELLKTDQRAIEINSSRKGLLQTLGSFLNLSLAANAQLEMPVNANTIPVLDTIHRPELDLFSSQQKLLEGQSRLVSARNLPRASVFVQGGYARPGLNFLKNEFDFYYIGGVRLNWSIGGLYTKKKEKEQLIISQKIIDAQKETFLLNTNASLIQQQAEIEKLQQLLETDRKIIDLRGKVKEAARAQLENGVITANDYLREVNAEDLARQSLIAHQLQLVQAQINYKTISGK